MTRSCDSDTDCSARGEKVSQPVLCYGDHSILSPPEHLSHSGWHLGAPLTTKYGKRWIQSFRKSREAKFVGDKRLFKAKSKSKSVLRRLLTVKNTFNSMDSRNYSGAKIIFLTFIGVSDRLWKLHQVLIILVQFNEIGIVVWAVLILSTDGHQERDKFLFLGSPSSSGEVLRSHGQL